MVYICFVNVSFNCPTYTLINVWLEINIKIITLYNFGALSPMCPFYSTYYKKLEGTFKLKSAMAALIENINIQNVLEKRKYPKDNPAAVKNRNDARKHKVKLTLVVNL